MAQPATEKKRTPHFEWCQDMDRLLIKILLSDVKVNETKLDITRDAFSFGYQDYEIDFSFRFAVNPKTIKYRSTRVLELVLEKESSNAYWPHLLAKTDKKKYKVITHKLLYFVFSILALATVTVCICNAQNHCKVDWNRFLDEDEAKNSKKGVVDDDDEYGNLNMEMEMNESESESDDSDDAPIDDLEQKQTDTNDSKTEANTQNQSNESDSEEMPPLEEEQNNNEKTVLSNGVSTADLD